ncbi:hypothetical protein [Streptomyces goshikiensis]|uniref:hypothetical protein n=1 Tax=Streptomyces goshikiensis TaxID=1942 RepID=UPI00364E92C3
MRGAQVGEPGRARPGVLRGAFAEHGRLGRALHHHHAQPAEVTVAGKLLDD